MPTFTHGKNTRLYISDGTTTPTIPGTGAVSVAKVYDISAFCKEVQFPSKMDTAETSTFGTQVKTYVQGLADRTISTSGSWEGAAASLTDTTAANATSFDALFSGLIGAAQEVKFVYGPTGSGAGAVKYYGSAILTDYQVMGGIGSLVEFSAQFQVSGNVSRGTF